MRSGDRAFQTWEADVQANRRQEPAGSGDLLSVAAAARVGREGRVLQDAGTNRG